VKPTFGVTGQYDLPEINSRAKKRLGFSPPLELTMDLIQRCPESFSRYLPFQGLDVRAVECENSFLCASVTQTKRHGSGFKRFGFYFLQLACNPAASPMSGCRFDLLLSHDFLQSGWPDDRQIRCLHHELRQSVLMIWLGCGE
jgi:hypothetical protein